MNKFIVFIIMILSVACNSGKKMITGAQATPPVLVYKTWKDYFDKVPIILNNNKNIIVSYPHPRDVFYKGKLAYPTKLSNGYLLDNRGLNKNVAFTKYTYEEYSKLASPPNIDTLFNSIIDNNPLLELYNCGSRYSFKNDVKELNRIIKKDFKNCKKIK